MKEEVIDIDERGNLLAAKSTVNYSLIKPGQDDFYNVDDFNQNMDIIDQQLKVNEEQIKNLEEQVKNIDVTWEGITEKPETYPPSPHKHSKSEISDFPTALPANGGNADTVDGKHATDFRLSTWTPTKADVGLGNVPNYPISTDPRESNHSKFASIGAVAQAMGMAEQAMRYVNELKPKVGSTAWKTNTSVTTVWGEDIGNQYTVLGHIVFRSEDEILIEMDSFQLVFDQTRYKADMAYATRTIGFVPSKTVGQPPAGSIIQVGTSSGADYLMKVYHNDNFDVKKALGVSNIELGRHTVTLPKVSFKATGMSLYSDFNAGNYVIVGRLEFASNYVANRDATMVHVSGWGANKIRVGWS